MWGPPTVPAFAVGENFAGLPQEHAGTVDSKAFAYLACASTNVSMTTTTRSHIRTALMETADQKVRALAQHEAAAKTEPPKTRQAHDPQRQRHQLALNSNHATACERLPQRTQAQSAAALRVEQCQVA